MSFFTENNIALRSLSRSVMSDKIYNKKKPQLSLRVFDFYLKQFIYCTGMKE